jgi:2-polyprenyl-3-methyl-5-hydroxy-6-metoxy-1,4-benzoquinol methylase
MECIFCRTEMQCGLFAWHYNCINCGYECSLFNDSINAPSLQLPVDENAREQGLHTLRLNNFRILADKIKSHVKSPGTAHLIEIGAGHGWFLEIAKKYFKTTTGLEPDTYMCRKIAEKGHAYIEGYFPEALPKAALFDVIVFNDAIEHIPKIDNTFSVCRKHLSINGILAINFPCSDGLFYKISKVLVKMGLNSPFERMWQKGFPSPHLHYFHESNLNELAKKHMFKLLEKGDLQSLSAKGLYDRIIHVNRPTAIRAIMIWIAILILIPIIHFLKSDTCFLIYRAC